MTYKRKEVIGNATLYLGDCMEVMPTLDKVDAVVTDPPYGIADKWGKPMNLKNGKSRLWNEKKDWDKTIEQNAINFLINNNNEIIIWGANYYNLPPSNGLLIWDKVQKSLGADCEIAWYKNIKTSRIFRLSRCEAFGFNHNFHGTKTEKKHHPTQKPTSLIKWCITHLPDDTNTILDPFMGSGSTGVAAVQMGREFIGIELDEDYFNIACKRIEDAQRQGDMFV